MITGLRGVVLLDSNEARYVAEALARFLVVLGEHGLRASPTLLDAEARLRKAAVGASDSTRSASGGASGVGGHLSSSHSGVYDLVDSVEAAAILGCTPANVRDLARRGRLPAHRAGRGWVYPAQAVAERAERQAAKRG